MRPTSRRFTESVEELDLDIATITGGGGAHDGADRLRNTTALADDATHVGIASVIG